MKRSCQKTLLPLFPCSSFGVCREFAVGCRPQARLAIHELVSLSRFLRRIRSVVPLAADATPDERPIEVEEVLRISSYFPDLRIQYDHLLSRFDRILLPGLNKYEAASPIRRKNHRYNSPDRSCSASLARRSSLCRIHPDVWRSLCECRANCIGRRAFRGRRRRRGSFQGECSRRPAKLHDFKIPGS